MEHRKTLVQAFLITLLTSLIFLVLLRLAYTYDNKYTDHSLNPINGILALTKTDLEDDIFFLSSGWQFYDQKLLTPEDFEQSMSLSPLQFITIGKYNDFSFGHRNKSPYGEASYRLVLELPETPALYSLSIPEIYSAYHLYINSELALSMGDITTGVSNIGKKTIAFMASGRTTLLFSVRNDSHYYSGITFPPAFGLYTKVQHYENTKLLLHSIVIALIFVLFAFSCYFGIRLKRKEAIVLSLYSLCLLFQTVYPVFFNLSSVHHSLYFGLELLSIYEAYVLIVKLQSIYFDGTMIGQRFYPVLLTIFAVFTFFYGMITVPNAVLHQMFSILVTLVKISLALYLLINLIYSACYKNSLHHFGAILTGIISVSLVADRLFPFYEPIYGGFFTEYSGILTVIFGACYLWGNLTETYRFKVSFAQEKKLLTRQVAIQKTHYIELTEKIDEARKQRHDIRHHLNALSVFLAEKDIDKAQNYLASCNVDTNSFESLTLCENTIVDALLQYYKKICQEHQITYQVTMQLPNQISIEDTDLSIIFGNLLENAYEACLNCKGIQPHILVKGSLHDTGFALVIENSSSNTIHKDANRFYSTKHNGYGIGTESVRAVVTKYHGMIEFNTSPEQFRVSMLLKIN